MNKWSIILIVAVQLCLYGCLDGPQMFKQDGSAADDYAMLTTAENGVTSGQFDPSSSGIQVMNAAGNTSIAGASAQFPPGALAVDVMISMQEGSSIANAALASELSISGNVDAAGSAVVISNSLAIDADKDFTMSVPRNQGGSLALASSDERLIVVYRVLKNGETFAGIIPNSALTISGNSITFQSRYFGSYQAALASVAIPKAVETASETPILTKNDEVLLDPLVFKVGSYSADAASREITWPIRVQGAEQLVRCTAFVHASKTEAPILKESADDAEELAKLASTGDVYHHEVRTDRAVTRHYRFACTDVTGRSVITAFYTAKIDAKPASTGSSANGIHFKNWLAAGTAYTSRLWDINGGPDTRAVAGGCDPGAGPVHVWVGGHELGATPTDFIGSFPCSSSGTFGFGLDIDTAVGTGVLDLPDRLGGVLVEASQGTNKAEVVIIKYDSATQTIVPVSNRAGLAGIPDNSADTIVYVLTADIEMGGCVSPWTSAPVNFGSILVGDLFHIKNLCINLTATSYFDVGLFADVHMGIVSHIGFDSPIVQGAPTDVENIGILAGRMHGSVSPALINHVWVTNASLNLSSNTATTPADNDNVGGIVGSGEYHGSLSEVMFDGVINAPNNRNVGGIVGNAMQIAVYDAFVGGPSPSTISGKINVGGIAGTLYNASAPSPPLGFLVRADVFDTTVEAAGESTIAAAGGLVGANLAGDISEARADVLVRHLASALNYSGGAVGKNYGKLANVSVMSTIDAADAIVGGMVGWESGVSGTSHIGTSYAITDFDVTSTGGGYCGGLIGELSSADASIVNDVWVMPELASGSTCNSVTDAFAGNAGGEISGTPPNGFYWYSSSFTQPSDYAATPSPLPLPVEADGSDLVDPAHDVYLGWDFAKFWRWDASGPPRLQWGGP